MNLSINKSDSLGIIASGLCLLHCLATPLLFAAQTQIMRLPSWWSSIDLLFLIISAIAIYTSTTTVTKKWVKTAFWLSWVLLLSIILNEKIEWLSIPEAAIYLPATSLVFLHIYSTKYCQCADNKCCTNQV